MADIKWIKIVTDIFDDEKILLIEELPEADSIIVIWFKLLCLAGKQNNCGVFLINDKIPYTEKMLATIFRRKESTVRLALETFETFGMIELMDGVITIPNWEKHQNIDGMEKVREQTRARVAKHREKQRLLLECNVTSNATVTHSNATDKDKEEDKEEDNKKEKDKKKKFVPPTVNEVEQYIVEKGYHIDPIAFVNFYQSKGWKIGKNPMVNWKAAVVTWEQKRKNDVPKKESKRNIDWDELNEWAKQKDREPYEGEIIYDQ